MYFYISPSVYYYLFMTIWNKNGSYVISEYIKLHISYNEQTRYYK